MQFDVGTKVRKITGYPFIGTIVTNYADEDKCVVRCKEGWDHIFHNKQLALDHPEYQYLDLLRDCMETGVYRDGRNGGTYGLFGRQIRFDLQEGFPLLTTKKIFTKAVIAELLWFISGSTNVKPLQAQGVTIWDEWADEYGDLGPIYGYQWRNWPGSSAVFLPSETGTDSVYYKKDNTVHRINGSYGVAVIDQLQQVIQGLRTDPYGRRHIVTAWNPTDIGKMALPPCHCLFQFFVSDGKLSCQLYQRSADVFLGVPFNIASYALLVHLIAIEVGLQVGEFVHTFGDVHLYANHVDQARIQLARTPMVMPYITVNNQSLFNLKTEDITIHQYHSHPTIKAEVSK